MSGRLSRIGDWEKLAILADFQPAKMAALCNVSQRQMQRFFWQQFQTAPGNWLRQLQCQLARNLIAQGFTTTAAARKLKFATASHFCREFKKRFSVPPQSFAP